ncbi:uncharacterized protein [Venturia canescens]|uniref:uncharacterized protein n=1 Tax=Venturia canescens TaxID=32260 RepID=UPI001C9BFC04|nr:uncharacterized protein LOC122414727 [Venturia canescens]
MESTPPPGQQQNEQFSLMEGIRSVKKMKDIEENTSSMELTPPINTTIHQRNESERFPNTRASVAVPREAASILRALPNFAEPAFVLATHLVPSLPIPLFEILAEILETITGRPVVLLHESRPERPVAQNIVDMAVLPVGGGWDEGSLLPVSFVFEHRLKTTRNPDVYVDVVVAKDCVRNIEGILDLRGYRCSLPDRSKGLGATALLFRHLNSKGENPSFFGDTSDSGSQLSTLQMVAGKQTEIGVLESPVFLCHKNTLHGIDSVCVLESLGPLPPYRIMLNKKTLAPIRDKIIKGLLSVACDDLWMGKLGKFGVSGFAEYNVERYDLEDLKCVVKSVPYY